MMRALSNSLQFTLTTLFAAALAACGGGGGGDGGNGDGTGNGDQSASVSLAGTVVAGQAVQGAAVCLDLNANGACDAGEPASARTGANGAYQLTATAGQAQGASLIALMTAESGAAAPYTLRQVPGKAGQINPLTTLVSAGIRAGMTEAAARANTALQLGIAEAKIDNYQDDPAHDPAQVRDNARTMAMVVADALQDGAVLQVGDQSAAAGASAGDLAQLRYAGAGDYYHRVFVNSAKAAGAQPPTYRDVRTSAAGGSPVTSEADLYPSVYLTPSGWKRCNADTEHQNMRGNPSRGVFCEASASVGYVVTASIASQPMAGVITAMRGDAATNTLNSGVDNSALLAGVGAAAFPEGSATRLRTNMNLGSFIFINDTRSDARPQAEATTLEGLIAAKPAAAVNLANAAGTLTLGSSTSALRNLRVAFTGTTSATAGTVQFYDCDLNAEGTVASNCTATQTGTYAIETVGGVRVMRFAGHAEATYSSQETLYAELQSATTGSNYVFRARQPKPGEALATSSTKRLNATAWGALKSQLGL